MNDSVTRKTFIRVIEFWRPDADGTALVFGGILSGDAVEFADHSRTMRFARGEGLPGQAWDLGHPIVLHELQGPYFLRGEQAKRIGLTCGIALPIFIDGAIRAVVVMFCGDDDAHAGAIELWRNPPAESPDMTLVDGYYGTTGDTFEFISRATAFRRGSGLPGMAWASGRPVFLPDLGKGSGFLRGDSAVKVGINRGFSMPCPSLDGAHYVITFLSALATPIARGIEIWDGGDDGRPVRRFAFSEPGGADRAAASEQNVTADPQAGPAARDALTRAEPVIAGRTLAIPVAPQGRVTSVLALSF